MFLWWMLLKNLNVFKPKCIPSHSEMKVFEKEK